MVDEYFDIVNENDEIIGKAARRECHEKNLIHRGVIIFIFNKEGKLLLQKRSQLKDLYRGYWDASASGHLDIGENYNSAAKRELKEELGIEIPLVQQSFLIKTRQKKDSENNRLFTGIGNGPFIFNKEEVEKVEFFSINRINKMISDKEQFTPFFLMAFNIYTSNRF